MKAQVPPRWEHYLWITLEALAVTLCMAAVVLGVYAVSVLAPRIW